MRRAALLLAILVLGLALAPRAAAGEPPRVPPPRLRDVRVWYYPPEPGAKPIPVLWWQPEKLRLQRPLDLSRKGRLRIRVAVSGGFAEDAAGNLLNWTSLVLRDGRSHRTDLPHAWRATAEGVKDVFWTPPQDFATGPLELEVAVWGGRTPSAQVRDRLPWIPLGRVLD